MNSNSQSSKKVNKAPAELSWVLAQDESFDHLKFFDFFSTYKKRTATSKFRSIVNYWIENPEKKKKLLTNYNKWKKSKAKFYWETRLISQSSEPLSDFAESGTIAPRTNTVTTSDLDSLKDFFERNILDSRSGAYIIQGVDISAGFYNFQKSVCEYIKENKLTYEEHPQQILSLSSVLLLSQNSHPDFLKFISLENLNSVKRTIRNQFGMTASRFPRGVIMDMLDIHDDLQEGSILKTEAEIRFLQLSLNQEPAVAKIVKLYQALLIFLPPTVVAELNEATLSARYLQPVFSVLFDMESSQFSITNENNIECELNPNITKKRPDGQWTTGVSIYGRKANGFLEVKMLSEKENHSKINIDLVRLGIFSKNSIDVHNLKWCMAIQAIGTNLTFFLTQKVNKNLLLMVELEHIYFPQSREELVGLLGLSDRLFKVLVAYSSCTLDSNNQDNPEEGSSETLSSPLMKTITESTVRTLETYGVGVSIIKQNTDTSRKSPKPNTEKKVDGSQTEHIEGLDQADLKSTEGKSESNSVDLKRFVQYIKTRASVKNTLYEYYENETTKSKETYFPESEFDFRVDQNCNLYYGNLFIARIRGFFPQPENYSTDSSVKSQLYPTYLQTMLQQKHISERLDDSEKSKVLELAKEMCRRPQQSNYKKTISTALEKLQLLPFRKLKFSSKLFFDQNDQKLVRILKAEFGQDAVLVFGD
ncbi:hypothetical protein G6F65_009590 [Rhizopus arrhizus]|nr:hypothetical protein G6F65_009590 [Rhizopus arrhizus]